MPRYTFENTETGEVTEHEMRIAELDKFKEDHPELQQLITGMSLVDPVLLGVKKPSSDFRKYVLGRIKEKVPGNNIGDGRWDIPKEY